MDQYLAEGGRLAALVNAHRAARDKASAEAPVSCNKRKSYRLPPLEGPTPIPGFPFRDPAGQEIPDYGSIARVKAIKARQRGRKMDPIGPPELVKRCDVRTWKVAE